MKTDKPPVRYEDAAEYKIGICGWVCKTCKRYWAKDENMARWCCATDLPCEDCDGRNPNKSYRRCEACQKKRDDEQWEKLERVEWDGETPLCGWRDDRYYFSDGELADYITEHIEDGGRLEDFRLVLCEPVEPRSFDMADYLHDDLPRDYEPGKDFAEIDKIVNDWIKARMPFSWTATNKAISLESLKGLVYPPEREVS